MTDVYTTAGEPVPRAVQVLADKYPACLNDDFSCCRGRRSRNIMSMIVELVIIHPVYSTDDGEDKLWSDLSTVALTAIREKDEVMEALESFLQAAMNEAPQHS